MYVGELLFAFSHWCYLDPPEERADERKNSLKEQILRLPVVHKMKSLLTVIQDGKWKLTTKPSQGMANRKSPSFRHKPPNALTVIQDGK